MESQGVLNPDAHMFVQEDFYQAEPDVMAAIMTQLSIKSGSKEWGDKAYMAAESEMKQLHFRNTFKPMHWSQLTAIQRQMVLETHMFLKEKRDGRSKGELWLEETNSGTTSLVRRMRVRRLLPQSPFFCRVSLMRRKKGMSL
jgi:hypothetical protein